VRYCLPCAVLVLALAAWPAVAADNLANNNPDPDQPYTAKKSSPVSYEVSFSAVVTPPAHTKVLKVWMPLPQTDSGQQVEEGELTTFPMRVQPKVAREPLFGNELAYFEFDHPEGAQMVRHTFKITLWELRWDLDPEKVVAVRKWPRGFDRYLRSEQAVVVDDRFREVAQEIVPRRQGEAADLTAVMDWINAHMTYDHAAGSLKADAVHALEDRKGHCSDYHGLCAALGRALGYPTRVTYGINTFPKNSPSHCKVEAFLPPYGWVSFDVSETQNLINRIKADDRIDEKQKEELIRAANERLRRGFRDNTWFVQTRGTDYDLAPPASKKAPVVRTIYVEADGEALSDPDPADPKKREFTWMTLHSYTPNKPVTYPFRDYRRLVGGR
jgi:transglutaminase-like putative cysteine protease